MMRENTEKFKKKKQQQLTKQLKLNQFIDSKLNFDRLLFFFI